MISEFTVLYRSLSSLGHSVIWVDPYDYKCVLSDYERVCLSYVTAERIWFRIDIYKGNQISTKLPKRQVYYDPGI